MRKSIIAQMGLLLLMIMGCAHAALPECPVTREIPWGSAPEQLGVIFQDKGQLPEGPFMGPGGFRVDSEGGIWIADSVPKAVKQFKPDGAVRVYPVKGAKLGDLYLFDKEIAVVTGSPDGIAFIDRSTGSETRRIDAPLGMPGRLAVFDKEHVALAIADGGVRTFIGGKAELHPAGALEPVGTAETLYGTLYDFDAKSRAIIRAGWTGETSEPNLFARYAVSDDDTIVFSRLLGMADGFPVLMLVTRSEPAVYLIVKFDKDGKPVAEIRIPIYAGSHLPAAWIQGDDGFLYAAEADEKAFRIRRGPSLK